MVKWLSWQPQVCPRLSFFLGVILRQATLSPLHCPCNWSLGKPSCPWFLKFRRTHLGLKGEEMGWNLKTYTSPGLQLSHPPLRAQPTSGVMDLWFRDFFWPLPPSPTPASGPQPHKGHNRFLSKCRSWPLSDQSPHGAEVCALLCYEPTPSVLGHSR